MTCLLTSWNIRLAKTYHEFPLDSMDQLLNLAIEEYQLKNNGQKPETLIDLGSGFGRLVLHAAINHNHDDDDDDSSSSSLNHLWSQVHGIEISSELYEYALKTLERGIHMNCLESHDRDDGGATTTTTRGKTTQVYFHEGPANEFRTILASADIIFCYSTVFDSDGFNVDMKAMILDEEWSLMLANACEEGTVVVTTDRALNPLHGWQLKQSLDVDNPALFGSTGFVSVKEN